MMNREVLKTKHRRCYALPFVFLVMTGFSFVSDPVSAEEQKKCHYNRESEGPEGEKTVYIGGNKAYVTGSYSTKSYHIMGLRSQIMLDIEKSYPIHKDGYSYPGGYKYRISYHNDDCSIYSTPLFGNSNNPIALEKNKVVYLYFNSKDDLIYDSSIKSDLVYGAGYYKVDLVNKTFEKIELGPKTTALLDAFGKSPE